MRLMNHVGPFEEEGGRYLYAGLQDLRFARDMLRRVGESERARFEELGWAYGEPSVYDGDPIELFRFQASVVVKTLFGSSSDCDLFCHYLGYGETDGLLSELRDEAGLAIYVLEGGGEETYHEEIEEMVLLVEIAGEPEAVWRVKGALRRRGFGPLHYATGGEYAAGRDRSEYLVLLFDSELYPEREVIHDRLFEELIGAWEVVHNRG
jgi:hypothetical protein